MRKAVIVSFDKFTDVDIFLSWDLLNRLKYHDRDFQVKIVGTKKIHKSVCGLDLATHGFVEECVAKKTTVLVTTRCKNERIEFQNG
jgi:hypothetical protein